mgnify:CR=1 FL=1
MRNDKTEKRTQQTKPQSSKVTAKRSSASAQKAGRTLESKPKFNRQNYFS